MLYIDTNIQRIDINAALDCLPVQRRDRALAISHAEGRRQCVAAYMLLKHALEREFGLMGDVEFDYEAGGKPFIKGHADIHFNLSHCRSAVACAVGCAPVGVDIETIRPFKERLAHYVLSDAEYGMVAAAARPDVEFTRLWTMKESAVKLSGRGLRVDLKSLLPMDGVNRITIGVGEAQTPSQTPLPIDIENLAWNCEYLTTANAGELLPSPARSQEEEPFTPHFICTVCRNAR